MNDAIKIRRVNVEFLRPGPAHNQLLSPYTQYLGVCNDAGAAVVTVPYEHRVFERRLKELRYETGDQADRLDMLHEIGRDLGKVLESVPGFTGALTGDSGEGALVHLRITVSAAELALLPFELAEVPVGSAASAVAIQTRPPVSITRRIRTVSSEGVTWLRRPRILFVSGEPKDVPFVEHRQALLEAIAPFQYPQRDEGRQTGEGREQFGELLTILVNPTLAELQQECESGAYTCLHLLTHGDLDALSNESYGLVMRHENGSNDVVSGERFVSAIARVGHRPTVVTVASCDSGNVGSVVIPGASFAHAVHQAGIPFVVGAQFPLSKEGSVPFTSRFYKGLLWGEHPLHVLRQVRTVLHARYNTMWHDWASVVVYEALPADLDEQIDVLRYAQGRRALDRELERVDRAVAASTAGSPVPLDQLRRDVETAIERLPFDGHYALECIGLRASAKKRLAQAAFALALGQGRPRGSLAEQFKLLEGAKRDYQRAANALLFNDLGAVQRKATLHWLLVQSVSLSTVLGEAASRDEWAAGFLAAKNYHDHTTNPEDRAWAHGSLAELWLLRLAEPQLPDTERTECIRNACRHAEEIDRLYPGVDEFPVLSTRRQFARYIQWWGHRWFGEELSESGFKPTRPLIQDTDVVQTAQRLVDILRRGPGSDAGGTAVAAVAAAASTVATPPQATPQTTPAKASAVAKPSAIAKPAKAAPSATEASLTSGATASAAKRASRRRGGRFLRLEALPAAHGDCLWIEYGETKGACHRLLIDCGVQATAKALLARVDAVPANERFLELFVMSHIDSDHIGGALPFFRAVQQGLRFGDVWYNGWRHVSGQLGARQGEMFSTAIQDFELPWNVWREGKAIVVENNDPPEHILPGGMKLTLLSPTRAEFDRLAPVWVKELKKAGLEPGARVDYRKLLRGTPTTIADAAALRDIDGLADTPFGGDNGEPNGTSIALLAEYGGAAVLLGADAYAPVLVKSIRKVLERRRLERLPLSLYKVSHHGSQNNVSSELVQLLDCPRYLVSTNGDQFCHPDRQAIARILKYGGDKKTIYFNYLSKMNEVWGHPSLEPVRVRYHCDMVYPPANQPGIRVDLL